MAKFEKITSNPKIREIVDNNLKKGASYMDISLLLKSNSVNISHTSLMNYDKHYGIKESAKRKSFEVDTGLQDRAANMDVNDLLEATFRSTAQEVLKVHGLRLSSSLTAKELAISTGVIKLNKLAMETFKNSEMDEGSLRLITELIAHSKKRNNTKAIEFIKSYLRESYNIK